MPSLRQRVRARKLDDSHWNTTSFPSNIRRCLCTLGAASLHPLNFTKARKATRELCQPALLELFDTRVQSRTILRLLVRQLVGLQLSQRDRAFAHVLHRRVTLHPFL